MRVALPAASLILVGAIGLLESPANALAESLDPAEVSLRFGPSADLRADLATEPAVTWPRGPGSPALTFDGTVATDDAAPRVRWARLDGGVDLWKSGGFALGVVGGATHELVPSSGSEDRLRAQARICWSARSSEVWLSRATSHPLGDPNFGARSTSAGGVWLRLGGVGVAAMMARTVTRVKEPVVVAVRRTDEPRAWGDSVEYWYETIYRDRNVASTEARLGLSLIGSRLEVMPTAGLRRVSTHGTRGWVQADASYWVAVPFALIARFSSNASDDATAGTGGLSITVGGRIAPWRKSSRRPMVRHIDAKIIDAQIERWELVGGGDGGRVLRIWSSGAIGIEVQSDVTGWLTVGLQRDGEGAWSLPFDAPPGSHQVLVRLDEGRWRPLPGAATREDDFGNTVSVLILD